MLFLTQFYILRQLKVAYCFIFATCRIMFLCDVIDTKPVRIRPRLVSACFNSSVKAVNLDLCLAVMVIEQWGFFSLPNLLWRGTSIMVISRNLWNSHHTAERLEVNYLVLSLLWFQYQNLWYQKSNTLKTFRLSG